MPEDTQPLWSHRYLTDGSLKIAPVSQVAGPVRTPWQRFVDWVVRQDWLAACGYWWRGLTAGQKWLSGTVIAVVTAYLGLPFLWLAAWVARRRERIAESASLPKNVPPPPEITLAAWDTIEARVAGAASRAWAETLAEPSWQSAYLSRTRESFDGWSEVRQIVDLAIRIQQARGNLGARPTGPAAEFWDRQQIALDDAARRLGSRADALIRHRDQAAALTIELQHLVDLERMERSAAEVDVLTIETTYGSGRGDGGLTSVAEDIAAVRQAMTDLVELMTRTRAPLTEPPDVNH
ncbi:hypothetical protein [Modestobacter marinus]|uniref:DUF4129 domain-containing protein n=2 Tax=Modestobacter marinus TaxID=477641 RepID=A0ABQ2GCH6_9ACTN|nr:hypothetical protein [Modestobacter marinus]GGL85463.1 hypothetical protein GCM10011589_47350 [Modestobacter marinus]